ncbi:MAG TPA: FtsQ-type POTRA domain-containing protein [Candidatus Acidoferrales bacterium]|jgi:cell division protein FtsQ|nr:FtsQ-type POTRA domain-containing protein [Candidatus Acidoferrales bacterium]
MSAEPDYLPADALAEDEPKYLRRQKPVEIRKRKFSRKAWPLYRRVLVAVAVALCGGFALYGATSYLLYSPSVLLQSADQIEIRGNRFVSPDAVTEKFSADLGHSVVRVPLTERREALETLPWVEGAHVQRVMPNRIRVEITERTPVAFLRTGSDLSLIDAHGVILERPAEGEFHFPVVSGVGESMALVARAQRMDLYAQFMSDIERIQPGATDHVSEADLSDAADLRATLTGIGTSSGNAAPVLVHFGDADFGSRYHLLAENIDQWRASAGSVDSVDLRFARQVVVNPESKTIAANLRPIAPPVVVQPAVAHAPQRVAAHVPQHTAQHLAQHSARHAVQHAAAARKPQH